MTVSADIIDSNGRELIETSRRDNSDSRNFTIRMDPIITSRTSSQLSGVANVRYDLRSHYLDSDLKVKIDYAAYKPGIRFENIKENDFTEIKSFEDRSIGRTYPWDTNYVPDGRYTLRYTVKDPSGSIGISYRIITILNLSVSIENIEEIIGGKTTLRWKTNSQHHANRDMRVKLEYFDGYSYTTIEDGIENQEYYVWDTTKVKDDYYHIRITVTDPDGRSSSGISNAFWVINDEKTKELIEKYKTRDMSTMDIASFVSDPIDSSTGAQVIDRRIMTLEGAMPLEFSIHYNSLLLNKGDVGNGWAHPFEVKLEIINEEEIKVLWNSNKYNIFRESESNKFLTTELGKRHDVLSKKDDGFVLTQKDNRQYFFDKTGKLTKIAFTKGHELLVEYPNATSMKVSEPVTGKYFNLLFNEDGLISEIIDSDDRKAMLKFDENHNLLEIVDTLGNSYRYEYTQNNQIVRGIDQEGITIFENTFDPMGRVIEQKDALQNSTKFSYDIQDEYFITTLTDRNNDVITYTHTIEGGRMISIKDELGYRVKNKYNANGLRISSTDGLNRTTFYEYDASDNIVKIAYPSGQEVTMKYDENNNVISTKDKTGAVIEVQYDEHNNPIKVIDPMGYILRKEYDTNGFIQKMQLPGQEYIVYKIVDGKLKLLTDLRGSEYEYFYDAVGRVNAIENGLGERIVYEYDDNDNLIKIVDPVGNETLFLYNKSGSLVQSIDPNGNSQHYHYNGNRILTSYIDEEGNETKFYYDGEDRLIKVIDPLGNETSYSYDARGNVVTITDAKGHSVTNRYDLANNLIKRVDTRGNKTTYQYNEIDKLTKIIDSLGNETILRYDLLGNLVEIIDAEGNKTVQEYDKNNQLIKTVNALGVEETFHYDSNGFVKESSTAENGKLTFQIKNGKVKTVTDALAQDVKYEYDKVGRIVSVTDKTGNKTKFSYDANGRITQLTDALGHRWQYQYDAVGNKVKETDPEGNETHYTYSATGQVTIITNALGESTKYEYDKNQRLVATIDGKENRYEYEYDALGQLISGVCQDSCRISLI